MATSARRAYSDFFEIRIGPDYSRFKGYPGFSWYIRMFGLLSPSYMRTFDFVLPLAQPPHGKQRTQAPRQIRIVFTRQDYLRGRAMPIAECARRMCAALPFIFFELPFAELTASRRLQPLRKRGRTGFD